MNTVREMGAKTIMTEYRQCFPITGFIFFFQLDKKNIIETVQERDTVQLP